MTSDVRTRAIEYLNKAVPDGRTITSDGLLPGEAADKKDFPKLTNGWTQAKLLAEWKPTPEGKKPAQIKTTCNEFVSVYSHEIVHDYLGTIAPFLEALVKKAGKSHAWVTPGGTRRPKPGDIVAHKGMENHVSVSLHLSDDKWTTIDAGQGGPRYQVLDETKGTVKLLGGHDMIKRLERSFAKSQLLGWVDIELFDGQSRTIELEEHRPRHGTTDRLWIRHNDEFAHPDAPNGRGGPGNFRTPGPLHHDTHENELPHPRAPRVRQVFELDSKATRSFPKK